MFRGSRPFHARKDSLVTFLGLCVSYQYEIVASGGAAGRKPCVLPPPEAFATALIEKTTKETGLNH